MVESSVANHDLAVAGVVGEVHHQSCELFRQHRLEEVSSCVRERESMCGDRVGELVECMFTVCYYVL